ncbi:rod shape-determining protein MreD [Lachnospiraceae bacterium]|nr:rod shape-determining protein MreD [Lachnospiraceae bacterium]
MRRKILEIIIIFIAFILQCTVFRLIALGNVVPNMMIILTSAFGFMRGKKEGMFVGFFCGILTDILFGNGIIGLYALIYVWIGCGNGLFNTLFYPEDIKFPIVLIGVSDLVYGFVYYVFTFLLRSRLDLGYYMLHIVLPEAIYTILVTVVVYRLLLYFEEVMELREKQEDME